MTIKEVGDPWSILVFDLRADDETGEEWEEFALHIGPFASYQAAAAHPTKLDDHQKRVYACQRSPEDPMYRKKVKPHAFVRDYDSPICKSCGLHRDEAVHTEAEAA